MTTLTSLNLGKSLLRQKRFQEAALTFERILEEKSEDSVEAAYYLGVMHHSGFGVPKNLDTAKTFYLMAAQSSHAMANYWLGVIYHHQGELSKAYKSFKSIAASNPSAAYRAYWILKARKDLDPEVDAERYLQDAVQQEHLAAQKTLAMRYISGREGLSKMLFGLILLVKMVFNAYRIAQSGETMKHK